MKTLTITVPAYNMEDYIEKCLSSMLNPEIEDRLEVLIINDGSTDNTSTIVSKFCQKKPNVFRLINKKNGGHGSAINRGIEEASGKYFKLVDADDWVNIEYLVYLMNNIIDKLDVDVVASDYDCFSDKTYKVIRKRKATEISDAYNKILDFRNNDEISNMVMHSLTIRTSILRKMPEKIDENCYYVDAEYVMFPMRYVNTVYCDAHPVYCYRLCRNGQSMNIKNMQKNIAQHMLVLYRLVDYYNKLHNDASMPISKKKYMARCVASAIEMQFQIYISLGFKKGMINIVRDFDTNLKNICPDAYYSTNKKSITILRKLNYLVLPLGTIAYFIYKKMRFSKIFGKIFGK